MASARFDPLELTVDASLNTLRVEFCTGSLRADQACSRDALLALAHERGLRGLTPGRLADQLAAAAAGADGEAARAAREALLCFGQRLGALIATLRDPRTREAQGDTPARRACLSLWLDVESIWLAGGLLTGPCGPLIMSGVHAAAAAAVRPCPVHLSAHPSVAPLLGAARRAVNVPAGDPIVVADLGHTGIRTAIAERVAGQLGGLRRLSVGATLQRGTADAIERAVADAFSLVAASAAVDRARPVRLIASVACYVAAGAPVASGEGLFDVLAHRVASLRTRVAAAAKAEVELEFVHDGTAAASFAGPRNSATITVGTWLAAGFHPPTAPPLLELAPELRVEL